MRFSMITLCVLASAFVLVVLDAATTSREPNAAGVLSRSFSAMGGRVPSDSESLATLGVEAGSRIERGTLLTRTRGTDQTSELRQTQDGVGAVVYSRGRCSESADGVARELTLELTLTSRSVNFPLIIVAGALNDSDIALEYVASETIGGVTCDHVRIWGSSATDPGRAVAPEFSIKDIWVASATSLPVKVAFSRREASGDAPRIPVEVSYSDYRRVAGLVYPFRIEKAYNGTPWMTLTVQRVSFDLGLTDADFQLE